MRQFIFIILGLAFLLSLRAQTVGDAFYIYRNDNHFNAFFRNEVDSISYSKIDADGVLCDEFVTQLVYTQDSIYRIPISAIDSIGFMTPETVYKPGVVKLEGEIRNYVVSTDSLTIFFMAETPTRILPKAGEYLFTEEVSSVFPIGFIGKVESVLPENGKISVSCSQVDFEDVFEYYYYVSDKTVYSKVQKVDMRVESEEDTWERYWSPGTFTFPLTSIITPNIYPDPLGELQDLSVDVYNNQSISFKPTFRVKYIRIVTPTRGTEVSLDLSETDVISEDLSMSGHINWNHDLLSTKDIPFMELGIPFLWLYGKVGVFFNADATINGEQHFKQIYKYTFHCEGSSRSIFDTRVSLSGIHLSSEHSGEILIKGLIELGIFGEIGVAFVDSRIASVAYRGEIGVGIEGNAMLYKKDAENALHSTDLYKTLKDSNIKFKWFYRSGIPVKLLWFGWPNDFPPHDHEIARIGLVPFFSDTKLERDPVSSTTLFASTKASGACAIPVDLGFKLFEQHSTNSVPTSFSDYGYMGMNTNIYASFFGMPTSKKYEVYPTVKLLGIEMLAEPKAKESGIPVELSDFEVTRSEWKRNGFMYNGKNYVFKFNTSVTAQLTDDTNVEDWGYAYLDPDGGRTHISLKDKGNYFVDNRYFYYRNEPESSVILYAYVKYLDNESIIYNEGCEFPLIYDEEPSITFEDAEIISVDGEPMYDEDGAYLFTWYTTKIRYVIKITGGFWIDNIQPIIFDDGSWSYTGGKSRVPGDGSYSVSTNMNYDNNSNMNWAMGYIITLTDGNTIYSNNALQFGGIPESPNVTVVNSYTPRKSKSITGGSTNDSVPIFGNMEFKEFQ